MNSGFQALPDQSYRVAGLLIALHLPANDEHAER